MAPIRSRLTLLAATLILCAAQAAAAAGDYNRMRVFVSTNLPADIKTVGEGAFYLAFPSGYQLAIKDPAPRESEEIALRPISPLFPRGKMMRIEEAVLELIGSDARLVVDHEHKFFSFEWHKEAVREKSDPRMPGAFNDPLLKRLHDDAKQAGPGPRPEPEGR